MLRELGGWDAWNVTEDADPGMRRSAPGCRVDVTEAGTPLLYPAQPITLAIWASRYTGFAALTLPAGPVIADVQLAVFAAWTALVAAAARRHHLVKAVFTPLLPAYWAMHWAASWRVRSF